MPNKINPEKWKEVYEGYSGPNKVNISCKIKEKPNK
jgi:hypothetical protein